MRSITSPLSLMFLVAFGVGGVGGLGLTGCEYYPERDNPAAQRSSSDITSTDERIRTLESQIAAGPTADDTPVCVPETDAEIVARLRVNCGVINVNDNCGAARTINGGTSCTAPATCGGGGTPYACGTPPATVPTGPAACTAETDAALCTRNSLNCGGILSVADNCHALRSIASCGTCTAPAICGGAGTPNVCGAPTTPPPPPPPPATTACTTDSNCSGTTPNCVGGHCVAATGCVTATQHAATPPVACGGKDNRPCCEASTVQIECLLNSQCTDRARPFCSTDASGTPHCVASCPAGQADNGAACAPSTTTVSAPTLTATMTGTCTLVDEGAEECDVEAMSIEFVLQGTNVSSVDVSCSNYNGHPVTVTDGNGRSVTNGARALPFNNSATYRVSVGSTSRMEWEEDATSTNCVFTAHGAEGVQAVAAVNQTAFCADGNDGGCNNNGNTSADVYTFDLAGHLLSSSSR